MPIVPNKAMLIASERCSDNSRSSHATGEHGMNQSQQHFVFSTVHSFAVIVTFVTHAYAWHMIITEVIRYGGLQC